MADIADTIQRLLDTIHRDPAAAESKYTLAQAAHLKPNQVEYVLYGRKDKAVIEAWHAARELLAEQRCQERKCSTCGNTYDAGDFPKDASDPCGIARRCKPCNRLHAKLAYQARNR